MLLWCFNALIMPCWTVAGLDGLQGVFVHASQPLVASCLLRSGPTKLSAIVDAGLP